MQTVEKAANYFSIVNLLIGLTGFTGPLVTGNNDRVINLKPGLLFGFVAINWLHALLHLLVGIAGLPFRSVAQFARSYLWFNGILFTALASMGWTRFGFTPGIHMVMGMALDWKGNFIHTLWALFGAYFGLKED